MTTDESYPNLKSCKANEMLHCDNLDLGMIGVEGDFMVDKIICYPIQLLLNGCI